MGFGLKYLIKCGMEKNERLKMAINYLRMEGVIAKDKDVADKMNASAANLSRALNGDKKALTESFMSRFNDAFGSIFDIDWLLYEENTMLDPNADVSGRRIGSEQKTETRPRLPFKALSGGGLRAYYAGVLREECEEKSIVHQFPPYQFTVYVDTNDMSPYLNVGDVVACTEVPIDFIIWGRVYVIDTNGGAMIRNVFEVEGDSRKIRLSAVNQQYPDFCIDKDKVNGIYKAVGSLRIGI